MVLWNCIVRHAMENGHRYLFGCASFDLGAGLAQVMRACERVRARTARQRSLP